MSTETGNKDRLDGDRGINIGPIDLNMTGSGPVSDTLSQPVVSRTVNSGLEDETMPTASTSVNAVKLDDNNYDQWSLVIENVLRSNDLRPYVLGKVVKPPEDYSNDRLPKNGSVGTPRTRRRKRSSCAHWIRS